jgi:hypothetical protein
MTDNDGDGSPSSIRSSRSALRRRGSCWSDTPAERELEGHVVQGLADQRSRRLDGIERETERPAEDVRRPARECGDRRVGAGEGVDDLVHRAVAREDDDQVDTVFDRLGRELERVTALLGLGDLELEVGRERLLDHGEDRLRERAGDRIDDEEEPLEAHLEGPV